MTSEEPKEAEASERRTATRLPATAVPTITGVRLSPVGSEATLVNISSSGVLVRCLTRLLPGTPVTVVFDGTFKPASIKGKVMRCLVADICKPAGLSYHIGIAFNITIDLDVPEALVKAPAVAEIVPSPAPVSGPR